MGQSFGEAARPAPRPAPSVSTRAIEEGRPGVRGRVAALGGGILGAVC